jgi:predicted RNA-binding Zn-ribbon protein involved in translation (DUF1610 family)
MSEPQRVKVADEPLRCKHCGADVFYQKSAALDRLALGGLLHLEGWWGHQATIYVCSTCGFLHLFFAIDSSRHERSEAEAVIEPVECLSCGRSIPGNASSCPSCGWSWESVPPEPA